jgi:monoamine oxidase
VLGDPATGPGSSEGNPLDVAVVGGGVSGAYTAWRLAGSNSDDYRSVALFEMSRRIGGRLLTLTPPDAPSLRAELGGMRFLSTQTLVAHVVSEVLGLHTSPAAVGEPQNIAYLRDHPLHVKDLDAKRFVLPYNVAEDERV